MRRVLAFRLRDVRHDFLATVRITDCLERRLPAERRNLLGYPAFEVFSHHLLHAGLHLRQLRERGGLRLPDRILGAGAPDGLVRYAATRSGSLLRRPRMTIKPPSNEVRPLAADAGSISGALTMLKVVVAVATL